MERKHRLLIVINQPLAIKEWEHMPINPKEYFDKE
jgi:hypothetical protein